MVGHSGHYGQMMSVGYTGLLTIKITIMKIVLGTILFRVNRVYLRTPLFIQLTD
jgi:hypothetical protein